MIGDLSAVHFGELSGALSSTAAHVHAWSRMENLAMYSCLRIHRPTVLLL